MPFGVNRFLYTGSAHQLWEQFRAAIWVIFWSALVTFMLMKLIGLVLRGAGTRTTSSRVGDLAIHGEEAFPEEEFAARSDGAFAMAGIERGSAERSPNGTLRRRREWRRWRWRWLGPDCSDRTGRKEDTMKLVVAVLKPFKLDDVKEVLKNHGVQGMTLTEAQGFGASGGTPR